MATRRAIVPFREAFRYWLKLGFINFGGPAGQIAIMHDELVDRKRWISNERFLHALNYCMLLPGPEAQQLAIYVGWLLNGTAGGIVAGVLFVLPAFFLILGLTWTYAVHGDITWVAAIFYGLRAAVIALVAAAVIRIGSKALKNPILVTIAALAFVGIFVFNVPFPVIVGAALVIGYVGSRFRPDAFKTAGHGEADADSALTDDVVSNASHRTPLQTVRVLLVCLTVWWLPLLLVAAWRGLQDTLSKEAFFFSQAAMVTFGGAYAVLAYINQAAVKTFGWLEPGEMVTGLGLAESTPGPLILVTEFVGFLAAYKFPGGLSPTVAGTLGAAVTVWATFAPCFLWIFVTAPYIERLRGNVRLNASLAAVTAAVVGVVLNLAVTFALAALFRDVDMVDVAFARLPAPNWGTLDTFALALAAASFVALWKFKVNVLWAIGGCSVVGLVYRAIL